jgi:hypothetical protein
VLSEVGSDYPGAVKHVDQAQRAWQSQKSCSVGLRRSCRWFGYAHGRKSRSIAKIGSWHTKELFGIDKHDNARSAIEHRICGN